MCHKKSLKIYASKMSSETQKIVACQPVKWFKYLNQNIISTFSFCLQAFFMTFSSDLLFDCGLYLFGCCNMYMF